MIGRGNEHQLHAKLARIEREADAAVHPDGRRFFRGVLIGLPLSALLWWGIIEIARAMV